MPTTRTERVREASRERREQQKQEVRQAILDAAAALFLQHGSQGLSLRQVAEQIGYSATTIYLYFADKDELLFTLADDGFIRFSAHLQAAAQESSDPVAKLTAIGQAYVAFGFDNPAHYQLMFIDRADFLLGYRVGERKPRLGTLDLVANTIAEGIANGQISPGPPTVFADALWASMHGVVALHLALAIMDRPRAEEAAKTVLRLMMAGLQMP
jgi:AcrR family transcriptional regulator